MRECCGVHAEFVFFRSSSNQFLSLEDIREKLKISALPLLRCAALFYHHLTGTSWPGESGKEEEKNQNSFLNIQASFHSLGLDEYSTICQYLGLPRCLSNLFDTDNERCLNDLMNNWILNLTTNKSSMKYPIAVNELNPLPKEYIDLMNQVSQG